MNTTNIRTEKYLEAVERLPKQGQQILGYQQDEQIVVYQAYNHQIADYALKNQKVLYKDFFKTKEIHLKIAECTPRVGVQHQAEITERHCAFSRPEDGVPLRLGYRNERRMQLAAHSSSLVTYRPAIRSHYWSPSYICDFCDMSRNGGGISTELDFPVITSHPVLRSQVRQRLKVAIGC